MNDPPLSLYVHLPWCIHKCPYCDFNSHALRNTLPEHEYTHALLTDLDNELARSAPRKIESVFFGGGTPSLFSAASLAQLLERIGGRLASDAEITLEANPGAVEAQRFVDYYDIGVNRLSLGVQSFNNDCLQRIGRIHDGDDARRAIESAQAAGFSNINLDLMYGLPQQTVGQALADVKAALRYQPAHVSQYQLTLEPGTVFYKQPPALPDEDTTWHMLQHSQAMFVDRDFERYEVSALAQPGRRSRHNLNYWQFGDYLGIGAGAHGKLTMGGQVYRSQRPRPPTVYMSDPRAERTDCVTAAELPFEFMLNALRLCSGFALETFEQRTGLSVTTIEPALRQATRHKLLKIEAGRAWPTDLGLRFLNDLQQLFLPENGPGTAK